MANFMTINVNGIRNRLNRQTIFRKIKNSNVDICFIQESFITDDIITDVKDDWEGNIIFSMGTNHSLGTMILLDTNFEYNNLDVIHASTRIICIKLEYDCEKYLLMSVYYPNEHNEKCIFHNEISLILDPYMQMNINIVVGGDYNCILNPAMDNIRGKPHNTREIDLFNKWVDHNELFDIWRLLNGNTKDLTT